jgi:hypothetical protein
VTIFLGGDASIFRIKPNKKLAEAEDKLGFKSNTRHFVFYSSNFNDLPALS